MKENFDNAGVAQKVATLLALPLADRALELHLMKNDFARWMTHNFNLKPHQMEQLNKLSAELRNQISTAISNYLMQNRVLQFQKDAKEKEDPDFKELTIHGLDEWQDGATIALLTPLFIRISYRNT